MHQLPGGSRHWVDPFGRRLHQRVRSIAPELQQGLADWRADQLRPAEDDVRAERAGKRG